jgi:hypothetical protein
MSSTDFIKLIGLLSKLDSATKHALHNDGSFQKYHTNSIEALKDIPFHLKKIEQGLKTAKVLNP